MSDIVLDVEVRKSAGTGGARAVRRDGRVPAVIYGGDQDAASISLSANELRNALNRGGFRTHMITIAHKGETQPVIVRDIQFDPVSDTPVHVDFYRVSADQIISVEVPVHFFNEEKSPGLKRGGTLNVVRHTIELDCPAGAIPEHIEVNLDGLDIGDSVHISAVTLPEGVSPAIKDRDFTVATIAGAGPTAEEEEEAAAAAEGEEETPETEVIKTKGKAEEEESADGDKKEKKED